jgi:hypothetical protein
MLVGPRGPAAIGPDDFEDRVHTKILVRKDRLASVVGIADEKILVQPTAAVEPGQIDIDRFVPGDIRADCSGAIADGVTEAVGHFGRREFSVVGVVVPKTGNYRRTASDQRCQSRKRIRRGAGGCIGVSDAVAA